jgi:hypothetical protein
MKNLLGISAAFALLAGVANAQQLPGDHPYYLHALTDLRAARWFLYHQAGDTKVYDGEDEGIREIDAAIGEMKRAAIDDGKNIGDHPSDDTKDHGSRLNRAIEQLKQAHADADHEEDNPQVQGLKHRILDHIDRAEHAAERAHHAWMQEMGK